MARISSDGSQLLLFAYLGTGSTDEARAIAVDGQEMRTSPAKRARKLSPRRTPSSRDVAKPLPASASPMHSLRN